MPKSDSLKLAGRLLGHPLMNWTLISEDWPHMMCSFRPMGLPPSLKIFSILQRIEIESQASPIDFQRLIKTHVMPSQGSSFEPGGGAQCFRGHWERSPEFEIIPTSTTLPILSDVAQKWKMSDKPR